MAQLDNPATPESGEARLIISLHDTRNPRIRPMWIFDNMVFSTSGNPVTGSTVYVYDRKNKFLGSAIFNQKSRIRARIFSLNRHEFEEPYIKRALENAIARRHRTFQPADSFRVVHSDADFLPGLVVDKIGKTLSVQLLTFAADRHGDYIRDELQRLLSPDGIIIHRDLKVRDKEGLERLPIEKIGTIPDVVRIEQDGIVLLADPEAGQKTGLFLDQRFNRRLVQSWAKDARVLDLFCYTGAWACMAAAAGAAEVTAVDSSEAAIELGRKAVAENRFSNVTFVEADAYEFLDEAFERKERFDVIVCDPPAFAKTHKHLDQAMRAYLSLNYRAMKVLSPGGVLITCSCSHYVSSLEFEAMLQTAARNVHRQFHIIQRASQSPDHPVLLGFPESEYLKCFVLREEH